MFEQPRGMRRSGGAMVAAIAAILLAPGMKAQALAADGALDLTFGIGGKVVRDIGSSENLVYDMAIQDDDKTVVAANRMLVRFTPSGALDPTFGNNGVVSHAFGQIFEAVTIQSDGKIVIAGHHRPANAPSDLLIARYHPNGTLDHSFGTAGKVSIDLVGSELAVKVAVRADGRIVIAGSFFNPATGQQPCIVRLTPNGSLDLSFNVTGFVIQSLGLSDRPTALALQPNGKIVVAAGNFAGYMIARFNANGSLDSSFNGGFVVANTSGGSGFEAPHGVAIQPDGAIVLTIQNDPVAPAPTPQDTFVVTRYRPNGTLDASFGAGGVSSVFSGISQAIALQGDGRILVAGPTLGAQGTDFGLARLNSDGKADTTFGVGGFTRAEFAPQTVQMRSMGLRIQNDGRIVVAGTVCTDFFGTLMDCDLGLARFEGRPPQRLTFFLNGDDGGAASTSGGSASSVASTFTMTQVAPPARTLSLFLPDGASWTADVPLTGVFDSKGRFILHLPCSASLGAGPLMTVTLWLRSANQPGVTQLGSGLYKGQCTGPITIDIPVSAAVTLPLPLSNQVLQLAIGSGNPASPDVDLELGPGAFLEATRFFGTPQ